MRYFIINTKNYLQVSGRKLDKLVSFVEKAQFKCRSPKIFLAVPAFDLRYLHSKYHSIGFLAQHLDDAEIGSSTGALVPEVAKLSGAFGSIINHSERRIDPKLIPELVARVRDLGMISVVCAKNDKEVSRIASCDPDFIAVEPPELIGTGRAVSTVSPMIITKSKIALDRARVEKSKTKLLCGAGIVEGTDAERAIELGAEGILVASGVIMAENWMAKIEDLSGGLRKARRQKK